MPANKSVSLRESLQLKPKSVPDEYVYRWIVPAFQPRSPSVKLRLAAPTGIATRIAETQVKARDVKTMRAKRFGDLLQQGMRPGEAAHRLKIPLKKLMEEKPTQKVVRELIENHTMDAKVRQLMARALVNKGATTLSEKVYSGQGTVEDEKRLLDYIKLLNSDTELGITAPTQVNIAVGLDKPLKDLLDSTIPVPQLEAPVDVEYVDVKEDEAK